MFRTLFSLAVASIVAATPVSAGRLLYSYVSTDGESAVAITDGPLSGSGTLPAVSCFTQGTLCDAASYLRFAEPGISVTFFGFAPEAAVTGVPAMFDVAAASTPGLYGGDTARLAVVALDDSDWVYSYVDTGGQAVVAITAGPIAGAGSLPAVTCVTGRSFCNAAGFLAFSFPASGVSIFTFAPEAPVMDLPLAFDFAAASTPGVYTGGATARLTVIGAVVPGPTSDVPEPAAWAMLVLGFGVVGAALRRRSARPALG